MIFNALIKSKFNYCPLWMFCSRQTNNMINKIHERALRIVLNDHISDFETILRHMNDITIHHRNIQTLMIELFKINHDLAPLIMDSVLNRRTICCNVRNLQEFQSEKKRTVFYGLETISYRATQLWTILPEEFKQRNTKSLFKSDVRQWICNECPWSADCAKIYTSRLAGRYMFHWEYAGICCYLNVSPCIYSFYQFKLFQFIRFFCCRFKLVF